MATIIISSLIESIATRVSSFIYIYIYIYIVDQGFLSQTFTNHRTVGEGGGHFVNSSLPLPPVSQTLTH